MKRTLSIVCCFLLLFGVSGLLAQDTTTQPTTTTNQETSNVTIFFVACETEAVMNLSGTMEPGFDVYYQVFSGAGGTGEALSSLRRVSVNGAYTFSERIPYNNSFSLGAGGTASARVVIARETNSDSTIFDTTVNDLQDGCSSPQNPTGSSEDAGGGTSAEGTTSSVGILSPFGGVINANFLSATPEPPVVIGVPRTVGRSDTPGVIFAECNAYGNRSAPGILYDTDSITIFWSWFARTEQQVQDHLANANYDITLNTAPFNYVQVTPIERRTNNYWAFYYTQLGRLSPGTYGIEFRLTWDAAISDGFDDYGPGTDNPEIYSNCTFEIQRNPFGTRVDAYNQMYSRPLE